jgi:pimeloyl-ACP methyl ester carboxylesterase
MVTLPPGFRAICHDQRGFGDADLSKKIDATRGLADLADDALALLDELDLDQVHIIGNSMGGSVIWWLLKMAPSRFISATVVAPGSPFGFGGSKDALGTPYYDDFAGAGAGLSSNPAVVKLVRDGYRGLDNPLGLRTALRMLVYNPPFLPAREEELLSASLAIHVGEQDWPGDMASSPNWPYLAPGQWGIVNALSPKYAFNVDELVNTQPKPDILWVRGSADKAVANGAASDAATLGALGLITGYPGHELFPPQPMIDQTRSVLDRYNAAGGRYKEIVFEGVGHVPFIESLEEFNDVFHTFLQKER